MSNILQQIIADSLDCLPPMSSYAHKVLNEIARCRTPEAGTQVYKCSECQQLETQYASCGSRYCNQCGNDKQNKWLHARLEELLPVQYFFLTFTIPQRLRPLFLYNPRECYNVLFRAVAWALKQATSYEHLSGYEIGFMAFLHTWKQDCGFHPHIHILMPGGGLAEDDMEWKNCKMDYLENGTRLAWLFRRELSSQLHKLYQSGKMKMPPTGFQFRSDLQFLNYVRGERDQKWNVHIEPTKCSPEHVLEYLSRYVHRTAVSAERIVSYDGETVGLRVKDRKTNTYSVVSMSSNEFVRRFCRHILPKGMARFRSYGFLSCSQRRAKMNTIHDLLRITAPPVSTQKLLKKLDEIIASFSSKTCRKCGEGSMKLVGLSFGSRRVKLSPAFKKMVLSSG